MTFMEQSFSIYDAFSRFFFDLPSFLFQTTIIFYNSHPILRKIATKYYFRFINPAIVSPYEMGIVEKQPQPHIKRGLMLMSKVHNIHCFNTWFYKLALDL